MFILTFINKSTLNIFLETLNLSVQAWTLILISDIKLQKESISHLLGISAGPENAEHVFVIIHVKYLPTGKSSHFTSQTC